MGVVRGVVIISTAVILVLMYMLLASVVIEPIGEEVKTYDSIDGVSGTSTINTLYDSMFKWIPLVFFGGFFMFAVAFVLFRERFRGQRGGLR